MHIRRNESFILTELEKEPYLLPYGQEAATHHLGVKLNATGVYLWNLLQGTDSYNDILTQFYTYYEARVEERQALKKDLDDFLKLLRGRSMITVTEEREPSGTAERTAEGVLLDIGGIGMRLCFARGLIAPSLLDFAAASDAFATILEVTLHPLLESEMEIGNIVIRTRELTVFETEDAFWLDERCHRRVKGLKLYKDGNRAELFYEPGEAAAEAASLEQMTEVMQEEIFVLLRTVFLYAAARQGRVAIHSASILYRERAWLFSGQSGAGKSTHTALWREMAADVEDINGDLNLVGIEDGRTYVYGLPWCGTSGIYRTGKYALGGVTFLSKGGTEQLLDFPRDEQVLYLLQRMITPGWTRMMFQSNVTAAKAIAHTGIALWHLSCTKEPSAALFMKSQIDDLML